MVPEGGADQPPDGPKRVPVYAYVAGVQLLDPGGTVKGPTTHLAGLLVPFEFNHHQRAIRGNGHQIDAFASARFS